MTDLERFLELYESIGVHLVPSRQIAYENRPSYLVIKLSETVNPGAFEGYCMFFSTIEFDDNGKFIKQGFWE